MTLPRPLGVLFDLDGVLVDSEPAHAWAYAQLFAADGIAFSLADYRSRARGRPREAVIRSVLGALPAAEHDARMEKKADFTRQFIRERGLQAVPGSLDLVDRLDRASIPYIVATSSRTPQLLLTAAGLADRFPEVVDRSQVERGKPAPDLFIEAARRLSLPPTGCWVIEDAEVGVSAGLEAGCTVVGLAPDGEFATLSHAHAVVRSLADVALT